MLLVKDVMNVLEEFKKIQQLKDEEKNIYGDYEATFIKTRKHMKDFVENCKSNKEIFASELKIFEDTIDSLEIRFKHFSEKSKKQDRLTQDFVNDFNENYKNKEFIPSEEAEVIGKKAEEMFRSHEDLELEEMLALNDTLPSKMMAVFNKAKQV